MTPGRRVDYRFDFDESTSEAQDQDGPMSLDALRASFGDFCAQQRTTRGEDAIRNVKYQHYFLGCGFVRFAGLGTIESVVKMSDNPNDRQNPRDRVASHVEKLVHSINTGKVDWRYPLVLFVNPDLVSPQMQSTLKQTAPFQPWSEPSAFVLNNVSPREAQLEQELFFECAKSGSSSNFLSPEELDQKRLEYEQLRTGRPLAVLGNGNHRIEAMRFRALQLVEPVRESAILLQKRRFVEGDTSVEGELREVMDRLKVLIEDLTWQVLVFRDDAPAELRTELIRNETEQPTMASTPGEEIWLFTQKVDALYARFQAQYPTESRAELMDRVHYGLTSGQKNKNIQAEGQVQNQPSGVHATKTKTSGRSRILGGGEGKEVWHRAPTEPSLLEMMLATRSCLQAWTKCLSPNQLTAMLRETGAAFAARFWLSLEVLQQISNIPDASLLPEVELFVDSENISTHGYERAAELWKGLHARQDPIPLGLHLYNDDAAKIFYELYNRKFSLARKHDDDAVKRDWNSEENIQLIRQIFDEWGQAVRLLDPMGEGYRRLSLAARLYSRLPLWSKNVETDQSESKNSFCFFPRATLPHSSIVSQWSRLADGAGLGAGVECLEFLLDRHKHMWSHGGGDKGARCRVNWYLSGRGTHYILMAFFRSEKVGCVAGTLTEALGVLESPDFRAGLQYLIDVIAPEHRVKAMRAAYGANKSMGLQVDLSVFVGRHTRLKDTRLGTVEEVVKTMVKEAQPDILRYIEAGNPAALPSLLARHSCLAFISKRFWETAPIILWGSGWATSGAQRRGFTAGVIMGWGMLEDAYQELVTDKFLVHQPAWPVVRAAQSALSSLNSRPWWDGLYDIPTLRAKYLVLHLDAINNDYNDSGSEGDLDDAHYEPPRVIPNVPASRGITPQVPPNALTISTSSTHDSAGIFKHLELFNDQSLLASRATQSQRVASKGRLEQAATSGSNAPGHTPDSTGRSRASGSSTEGTHTQSHGRFNSTVTKEDPLPSPETAISRPPSAPVPLAMSNSPSPTHMEGEVDSPNPSVVTRPPTPTSGNSIRQILEQVVPPGVSVTGLLSAELLPGLDGQIFAHHRYKYTVEENRRWGEVVAVCGRFTRTCMHLAFEARQALRHNILSALRSVFLFNGPDMMLMENVAPHIYMIKLSYLRHVAAAFEEAGLCKEDAWAEASFMVGSDGTLTSDSFSWDHKTGALCALLQNTLPRAVQSIESMDSTTIFIGTIESSVRDPENFYEHDSLLSVVAQGQNQGESLARAAINVFAQAQAARTLVSQNNLKLGDSARAVKGSPADFNQRRVFRSLRLDRVPEDGVGCNDDIAGPLALDWESLPTPDYNTLQDSLSCFSTGIWVRPEVAGSSQAPARAPECPLRASLELWNSKLRQEWDINVARDLASIQSATAALQSKSALVTYQSGHPNLCRPADRKGIYVPPALAPRQRHGSIKCSVPSQRFPFIQRTAPIGIPQPESPKLPAEAFWDLPAQGSDDHGHMEDSLPPPDRYHRTVQASASLVPISGSKRQLSNDQNNQATKRVRP